MGKYKFAANFLLFVHFLWVIFSLAGTIYMINHRWYISWHLTIITSVLFINLFLGYCPLTLWEEKARRKVEPNFSHNGSCIATYLHRILGVKVSEKTVIVAMSYMKFSIYILATAVFFGKRP